MNFVKHDNKIRMNYATLNTEAGLTGLQTEDFTPFSLEFTKGISEGDYIFTFDEFIVYKKNNR